LVHCRQENRQRIVVVNFGGPPFADDLADEVAQAFYGPPLPPLGGRRKPIGEHECCAKFVAQCFRMDLQCASVKVSLVRQVHAQERVADADERQSGHRRDQIKLGAIRPTLHKPLGMFDGRLGIVLQQPRLERGLQQAALPQPLVPFADEYAVPGETANRAAVALELRKQRALRDQDLADQIRMIDQAPAIRPHGEHRQVPIVAHEVGQKFEGIPPEPAPQPEPQQRIARSWGKRSHEQIFG
jgi:hypothetical protein